MHNAAFDALGLKWRYVLLPAPRERLEAALAELKVSGYAGANVTTPHKQVVMPCLDTITKEAQAMGAVNTIAVRDGQLGGYNTDGAGFLLALRASGFEPRGQRAVVMGAGGAARAVVHGLVGAGAQQVVLLNRTVARARAMVADLAGYADGRCELHALPLTLEALVESTRVADLFVNATTLGMWPRADASPWPSHLPFPAHLVVSDLVYNPQETRLLSQARDSGAQCVGGLEMLVRQGALAFQIWTGESAPLEVMRRAAREALER
jgi:shikimate dehydrogenase